MLTPTTTIAEVISIVAVLEAWLTEEMIFSPSLTAVEVIVTRELAGTSMILVKNTGEVVLAKRDAIVLVDSTEVARL